MLLVPDSSNEVAFLGVAILTGQTAGPVQHRCCAAMIGGVLDIESSPILQGRC